MQTNKTKITVAYGDGIGPEIMTATLAILNAAGAELEYDVIEVGEKAYLKGHLTGITPESWDTLQRNKIFLKSPITTPQGGGFNSLNVTIRKSLGLFANVRPCKSFSPFVQSHFPKLDLVIVRENEEDLYAGIEHQQTSEVVQCLKLISRPGCENIVRYAFEYARANNRKEVTCMSKDNIMKMTDGMFHRIFDEIAQEYPDIKTRHLIIDIGSALLADRPEGFQVIVTLNLYGDIISDIAAEVAGSVGLGGSANIGRDFAMFEAIHGSAPDIAGKDMANPSGLLNGACMMLVHLGQNKIAERIQNAWLKTIEDGIHTGDIASSDYTKQRVGTQAFAQAIIERLGQKPQHFEPVSLGEGSTIVIKQPERRKVQKQLVGVDVFLNWDENDRNPDVLGEKLRALTHHGMQLKMISNRGVRVFPEGIPGVFCTDHWRCRFVSAKSTLENGRVTNYDPINHSSIYELLQRIDESGIDAIKTENLYLLNGQRGYSLAQGE